MEPDGPLAAAPKPSLIIKLLYRHLCAQCMKMLPIWCDAPVENHWSLWTWTIDTLKQDSLRCHCCRFLIQALEASPWLEYGNYDQLTIRTSRIGSEHISQTSSSSEFRSCYRPLLYVDQPRFVLPKKFSIILPVSQITDQNSDERETQTFCGRRVNAVVDSSLIASWYKTCTSRHQNSGDGHECCPHTRVYTRFSSH
jgi:hypothetical protein